jgi:hypothetical protein
MAGPYWALIFGFTWFLQAPSRIQRARSCDEFPPEIACFACGRGKNRTFNKRIKSPLLCQLSYAPGYSVFSFFCVRPPRARGESNT